MVIPPLITFPHHEALATASAKLDAAAMGIIYCWLFCGCSLRLRKPQQIHTCDLTCLSILCANHVSPLFGDWWLSMVRLCIGIGLCTYVGACMCVQVCVRDLHESC